MADRLKSSIREVDSAIRWGGEEFLVLLRHADPEYVGAVAERIRATIGTAPFELSDGRAVRVTCSVGNARFPLGPFGVLPIDDVVRIADAALYLAKREGRDRIIGIDEGERGMTVEAGAIVRRDVSAALTSGHLRRVECAPPTGFAFRTTVPRAG